MSKQETPTPVAWSETPPSEDGHYHLLRLNQSGHSEPLIGQKTGNWWLILGWNCDEYCSEDLVRMGITFGPRITIGQPPPALPANVIEAIRNIKRWREIDAKDALGQSVRPYEEIGCEVYGISDWADVLVKAATDHDTLINWAVNIRLDGGQA